MPYLFQGENKMLYLLQLQDVLNIPARRWPTSSEDKMPYVFQCDVLPVFAARCPKCSSDIVN